VKTEPLVDLGADLDDLIGLARRVAVAAVALIVAFVAALVRAPV
jgi:hypothetical protein